MGLHVFGFVAESTRAAADTIYPGWHEMFAKVSRERGFSPAVAGAVRRHQRPGRRLLHGRPGRPWPTKLVRVSEQLGGVDRISLQMTNPRLAHADLLRGIELLGTEVAPRVAGAG